MSTCMSHCGCGSCSSVVRSPAAKAVQEALDSIPSAWLPRYFTSLLDGLITNVDGMKDLTVVL